MRNIPDSVRVRGGGERDKSGNHLPICPNWAKLYRQPTKYIPPAINLCNKFLTRLPLCGRGVRDSVGDENISRNIIFVFAKSVIVGFLHFHGQL